MSKFGPSFLRLCLLCTVKKFRLDSNKTDGGDTFWNFRPYGDSGNGIAAAARRSPGYCNWTGGAASCCDRSLGAFRTAGIQNWGRSELGAQLGRKNPPACFSVSDWNMGSKMLASKSCHFLSYFQSENVSDDLTLNFFQEWVWVPILYAPPLK